MIIKTGLPLVKAALLTTVPDGYQPAGRCQEKNNTLILCLGKISRKSSLHIFSALSCHSRSVQVPRLVTVHT